MVPAPGVLGNDTDVDTVSLSAVKLTDPDQGTLTFNADGSFTYTAPTDVMGDFTFTYKVNDGIINSNDATVTISVTDVNRKPVVTNESYSTPLDTELVIEAPGLLNNATDEDSDPLTAVKATDPSHGTAVINPDGSFSYIPELDFAGTDTFTYVANDGAEDSDPATVSVTVNRDPNAPTATNDGFTMKEDKSITVRARVILKNDTDPAGLWIKAILMSKPAHGKLYFRPNGYFIYKPTKNWNGTDTFTYRATNGKLVSNIATVSITVTPRNDLPVARYDKYTNEMNTVLTVAADKGILANDFDVDGDALSIEVRRQPYHGKLVLEQDGSFTYTPKDNFLGSDYFSYRLFDGKTYSAVVTANIKLYRPTYTFSGFFDPVQNKPTVNLATAGNSIPVRFSLGGDRGPIVVPNAGPTSVRVTCPKGERIEISEYSTEPAGMTYDGSADQYTYVWKTNPNWARTCRRFNLKLNDGTIHNVMFRFQ